MVASEDRDSGTESDDEQTYDEPEVTASSEMSSEVSSGCSVRSRPTSQTSTDTLTCEDLPMGGDAPEMPPPSSTNILCSYSQSHGGQLAPSSHAGGPGRRGGARTPKHSHNYQLRTSDPSRGSPAVEVSNVDAFLDPTHMSDCDACDPVEHHSSEEELEPLTGPWLRDSNGPQEKRKWSQRARLSSTDSGSSDDEVCCLTTGTQPPVKFRTSPPLQVHKPLRSVSPPPKMLTLSASQRHVSISCSGDKTASQETSGDSCCCGGLAASGKSELGARAVSPRKRHRHTPRPYRPCLDFEKMQQMKNRAVTQWRNGGELSLSFF